MRDCRYTVQTGMFVASPDSAELHQANVDTQAKGAFDHVAVDGGRTGASGEGARWGRRRTYGYFEPGHQPRGGGFVESAGTFGVTGSGDIGPYLPPKDALGNSLVGLIVALIVVIAVATLFVTAEYRRGLIRTTLSASPRRGRVLAAKVIVSAVVAFALGLVAAAIDLPLAEHLLRSHGYTPPWWLTGSGLWSGTGLRIALGTGALFALSAALAVAVGTIARRGAAAITTAIVVSCSRSSSCSRCRGRREWFQNHPGSRLQSPEQHPSVPTDGVLPTKGCFALSPWAGLGVFALYAGVHSLSPLLSCDPRRLMAQNPTRRRLRSRASPPFKPRRSIAGPVVTPRARSSTQNGPSFERCGSTGGFSPARCLSRWQ